MVFVGIVDAWVVAGVWELVAHDVVVVAASSVVVSGKGAGCTPVSTRVAVGGVCDEEEQVTSKVVSVVASIVVLEITGDVRGPVPSWLGRMKGIGEGSGDA